MGGEVMAKEFYGAVSSTAADKTIVVTVNTSKTHPLYRKKYMVSKKFAAHDEKNEAQVGDMVVITETRPISKRKRFVLARIEKKAAVKHVETEAPAEEAPKQEEKESNV
jgi:small subunit ribosomal protein S17